MTELVEALNALGIRARVELGGRWATIAGERGRVYVMEAAWGSVFYAWCDIAEERAVIPYPSAREAIRAGLRRASAGPGPDAGDLSLPPPT